MTGVQTCALPICMGTDGNNVAYPVCESVSTWGIWCKDIPFKLMEKVKEPAKRSWFDEHGDDEYIPAGGLYADAYTMKVEFGCKKTSTSTGVRERVGTFLSYLRTSGMLKMYSSYTRIGRQDVRFDSVSDSAKWESDVTVTTSGNTTTYTGDEFLIFEVTFKVNDPVTDVVLSAPSTSSTSST